MKKNRLFEITVIIAVIVFSFIACRNDLDWDPTQGSLKFRLNDKETAYTVAGFVGSPTSIEIPSSVNGLPVIAIGDINGFSAHPQGLRNCSSLISIKIPNSITSIGFAAFAGCSSLTSITIPNSVTYIGDDAFSGCSSLTSITIPSRVTYIGDGAFADCTINITVDPSNTNFKVQDRILYSATAILYIPNISGAVTIPYGITSIGDSAFYGQVGLSSITIPNSVTSIGGWAFSACISLSSITIPNSVTSIGDAALWGCEALTSVTFEGLIIEHDYLLGDLSEKYIAGGIGTYTREAGGHVWTKQ